MASAAPSALKNADVSSAMVADKVRCVLETRAEVCTAADNSCLMHIGGALSRRRRRRALPPHRGAARVDRTGRSPADDSRRRRRRRRLTFPSAAKGALANVQLRRNVRHATTVIRDKRAIVVGEMDDWEELRDAAHRIKDHVLRHLDFYLAAVRGALHARRRPRALGARRRRGQPRRSSTSSARHGQSEIIKVKTMTSDETRLNVALEAAGISPYETDLADLIIQLGDGPAVAHRRAGAAPQPHRDPRHLPRARCTLEELTDQPPDAGRGGAAVPAREVPARAGRLQRRELRGRRHRLGLRGRVGGQRPHVRDAAASADHAGRHRKDHPERSAISKCSCSCCRGRRPASG